MSFRNQKQLDDSKKYALIGSQNNQAIAQTNICMGQAFETR